MQISTKQLQVFSKTAEQKTVSKAAEKLFMTQSAASMALSELEKSLDQKLFERQGRKLILNEQGIALLPKANEIVGRLKEIEEMFSVDSASHVSLKLGASSTIGNYFLPSLLGRFTEETMIRTPVLEIRNTQQILNSIENYELDFGFVEGHEIRESVQFFPWRKDRLILICSPRHELAQLEKITIEDLSRADWIMREKGSGSRSVFEGAIDGKLSNLNVVLELGNTEAIKGAVSSGFGMSCVSLMSVKKMLRNQELVALRAPFLNLHRDLYMVIHKKKYQSQVLRKAIEYWSRFSLST